MRPRRLVLLLAVSCAAGLSLVATATTAAPPVREALVPKPPDPHRAWTGRLLVAVTARAAPRRTAAPRTVLQPVAPLAGGPTSLLITRSLVRDGRRWHEVLLPVRPNGTRGWVPANVLQVRRTAVRVLIDVGDRRMTVYRAGRAALRAPVAVGMPGTPTPIGSFAIAERIPTNTPGAFLGPVVLPLTGYSETLNEFAGGNGRVAIHGTSLPGLIGSAVSHGCIRMRNPDVLRLAALARAGTPVTIRP